MQKETINLEQLSLASLINHISQYVAWKDTHLVYQGCNERFASLVGLKQPKHIVGKTDADLPWGKLKLSDQEDKEVIATGKPRQRKEVVLIGADGKEILTSVNKIPLRSANKKIMGVLSIYTNLTLRKKKAAILEAAKERAQDAEEANRAKSEFLGMISHELRIPLTGIIGMAQLLSLDCLLPTQQEQVEDIIKASEHLLTVVTDLLDLTKLEAGKMELHPAPLDLRKLIEEIATILTFPARAKGLEILVSYTSSVPHLVIADARILRQLLLNLLGNAIKFTERGYVTVKVECKKQMQKEAELVISVEDTGIGIAPNKIKIIFDRFKQADSSNARYHMGIGMGLTLSKAYVELMRGKIDVQSRVGKGSTFSCTIPFALQNEATLPSTWESYKSLVRILVVDDTLRGEVLQRHLDSSLSQVVSGRQALNTLLTAQRRHEPFDVVIIDQQLTSVDYMDLANNINQQSILKHPMLLLLTTPGNCNDKEQIKAAGFTECLIKPVHPSELLTILTAAWEKWAEPRPGQSKTKTVDPLKKIHVLLVEDDPIVQRVHLRMLEKMGCVVDLAENADQAFEKINKSYDLILMDVGLPDVSGLEITAEIRRREGTSKHTPIIALTGYGHAEDQLNCIKAGMDEVAIKPVDLEKLRNLIARWAT